MSQLPYEPNEQQTLLIVALAHFMLYAPERGVFLLSGYAGTGKTSLTGALVRTLTELHRPCVLIFRIVTELSQCFRMRLSSSRHGRRAGH